MYCIRPQHAEFCLKYARQVGIETKDLNVFVRDVPFNGNLTLLDKVVCFILNSFLCIFCLMVSLFKKDASKLSILCLELTESTILLSNLLKYKTKYVYYFSAYEKDSNFIALLMQTNHIFCHKIPSSNPIKNFYAKVIADKFSFTAPFQINEYPSLKANWNVKEFDLWPNMGFQNLQEHIIERKGNAPINSIGIFTRGIWLRKLRGDSFLGVGEDDAEVMMLNELKNFLCANSHITVVYILLHPTEKKTEEQFLQTKAYYENLFSGVNVVFTDPKLPSYDLFNLFDVGITSLSSVVFERLYCGYKCLLAPINLRVKLYEDANLENIIVNKSSEFADKLLEISTLSNEDYFLRYHLENYRLNQTQKIVL